MLANEPLPQASIFSGFMLSKPLLARRWRPRTSTLIVLIIASALLALVLRTLDTRQAARIAILNEIGLPYLLYNDVTPIRDSELGLVSDPGSVVSKGLLVHGELAGVFTIFNISRSLGCQLPIGYVLSVESFALLSANELFQIREHQIDLVVVRSSSEPNASQSPRLTEHGILPPTAVQAALASRFDQALWMSSDTVPLSDPSALFDLPQFRQDGILTWLRPSLGRSSPSTVDSHASGVYLIDRRRHKDMLHEVAVLEKQSASQTRSQSSPHGDQLLFPRVATRLASPESVWAHNDSSSAKICALAWVLGSPGAPHFIQSSGEIELPAPLDIRGPLFSAVCSASEKHQRPARWKIHRQTHPNPTLSECLMPAEEADMECTALPQAHHEFNDIYAAAWYWAAQSVGRYRGVLSAGCKSPRYHAPVAPVRTLTYAAYRSDLKSMLKSMPPFTYARSRVRPGTRGIVMTGGPKDVGRVIGLVRHLRAVGCLLPVEVLYFGDEYSADVAARLRTVNVTALDMSDPSHVAFPIQAISSLRSKKLGSGKLPSIVGSSFEEVLYLDPDNFPVRDPSYLFDSPEYRLAGTVLWTDYWRTSRWNPIWHTMGLCWEREWETESGMVLVHKRKAWRGLVTALYMNIHSDFYYQLIFGDKDTFRFGYKASGTPYYANPYWVNALGSFNSLGYFCGTSMLQSDISGNYLFVHANLVKYDLDPINSYANGDPFAWIVTFDVPRGHEIELADSFTELQGRISFSYLRGLGLGWRGGCVELGPSTARFEQVGLRRERFDAIAPDFTEQYMQSWYGYSSPEPIQRDPSLGPQ
ncbi:mannosyltransferase putative-domain-containing protein [Polychytrium aggregatum]|uniref:mannosyltransferase putative-domain-containing protein n=1 Tax=Polychytrium aggregatum TaxID=110093 RepID=UPI0022FF3441|nr:mannosyltransferase putative-domain-containing protein [Polychytrium aggregatum]KAI9209357.1 mannosyltransferase putative-domain-containing protein [Polychytrium aggregatum]